MSRACFECSPVGFSTAGVCGACVPSVSSGLRSSVVSAFLSSPSACCGSAAAEAVEREGEGSAAYWAR